MALSSPALEVPPSTISKGLTQCLGWAHGHGKKNSSALEREVPEQADSQLSKIGGVDFEVLSCTWGVDARVHEPHGVQQRSRLESDPCTQHQEDATSRTCSNQRSARPMRYDNKPSGRNTSSSPAADFSTPTDEAKHARSCCARQLDSVAERASPREKKRGDTKRIYPPHENAKGTQHGMPRNSLLDFTTSIRPHG